MKRLKKSNKSKKIIFILSAVVFIVSLAIIVNLWIIEPYKNSSTTIRTLMWSLRKIGEIWLLCCR